MTCFSLQTVIFIISVKVAVTFTVFIIVTIITPVFVNCYSCQLLQLSIVTVVKCYSCQLLQLSIVTVVDCYSCRLLQLSIVTVVDCYSCQLLQSVHSLFHCHFHCHSPLITVAITLLPQSLSVLLSQTLILPVCHCLTMSLLLLLSISPKCTSHFHFSVPINIFVSIIL